MFDEWKMVKSLFSYNASEPGQNDCKNLAEYNCTSLGDVVFLDFQSDPFGGGIIDNTWDSHKSDVKWNLKKHPFSTKLPNRAFVVILCIGALLRDTNVPHRHRSDAHTFL